MLGFKGLSGVLGFWAEGPFRFIVLVGFIGLIRASRPKGSLGITHRCPLACTGTYPVKQREPGTTLGPRVRVRVWGLGFGLWGLGFGVWGLGFRV